MVLSIDTFSDILGLSIIDGHRIVVRLSYTKVKPFSELIVGKIHSVFNELGYDLSVLYGVAVNIGPGSYTGLRVGITVAKTLAYAQGIKLFSYPSLDAIAFRYRHCGEKLLAGIYAGQGEVYTATYRLSPGGIQIEGDMKLVKKGDFLKMAEEFDGSVAVKNIELQRKDTLQIVEDLSVDGCFYALKENREEDPLKLEPVYLRSL
ncbi:tRNA (adenosine(37)-N6)-threonylcarbamoyltransferase complex dimerization subunit type 1 TsaB [Persephonella sp.]